MTRISIRRLLPALALFVVALASTPARAGPYDTFAHRSAPCERTAARRAPLSLPSTRRAKWPFAGCEAGSRTPKLALVGVQHGKGHVAAKWGQRPVSLTTPLGLFVWLACDQPAHDVGGSSIRLF